MDRPPSRRQFLTATATALTAGLAGCNNNQSDGDTTTDTTTKTTTTEATTTTVLQHETQVKDFEAVDPTYIPVVDSENREAMTPVKAEISDENGLAKLTLTLDGATRDSEYHVLEKQISGESHTLDASVLTQQFAPGENQLTLQIQDTTGHTTKHTASPLDIDGNGYRLDTQHVANDGYGTERGWDNSWFSQERIDNMREDWVEAAEYDDFVEQLKNESDHLSIEFGTYEYPDEGKQFHLEKFKKQGTFSGMLEWLQPAVIILTYEEHGPGPPSGFSEQMAASAEQALAELKDLDTRGWEIHNDIHGTMMFYTDDDRAEHHWYHVDSTATHSSSIGRPEDALSYRVDWSPFRSIDADQPGFHKDLQPEEVEEIGTYDQLKGDAWIGIRDMVFSGHPVSQDSPNTDKLFVTDEWLGSAYSQVRNNGKVDPILDPLEEMADHHIQTREYVGIYGTGLDDTRLVAGEDLRSMYDKTMENPKTVTVEQVERALEDRAA